MMPVLALWCALEEGIDEVGLETTGAICRSCGRSVFSFKLFVDPRDEEEVASPCLDRGQPSKQYVGEGITHRSDA